MKRNKKQQYRVTRYELNDKNELVKVDNPVNCNPKKSKEMEKLIEVDLIYYCRCNSNPAERSGEVGSIAEYFA